MKTGSITGAIQSFNIKKEKQNPKYFHFLKRIEVSETPGFTLQPSISYGMGQ